MLYLVQVRASMERANTIDAGEGPGPVFAKVVKRFRPEAFYGNPTGRETFMVVNLDTPAQIAELVLVLDDDVLVRMPICQYLRDCGYRVLEPPAQMRQ
jgi:hypothetical protein